MATISELASSSSRGAESGEVVVDGPADAESRPRWLPLKPKRPKNAAASSETPSESVCTTRVGWREEERRRERLLCLLPCACGRVPSYSVNCTITMRVGYAACVRGSKRDEILFLQMPAHTCLHACTHSPLAGPSTHSPQQPVVRRPSNLPPFLSELLRSRLQRRRETHEAVVSRQTSLSVEPASASFSPDVESESCYGEGRRGEGTDWFEMQSCGCLARSVEVARCDVFCYTEHCIVTR